VPRDVATSTLWIAGLDYGGGAIANVIAKTDKYGDEGSFE
jgi:hypothetical protein